MAAVHQGVKSGLISSREHKLMVPIENEPGHAPDLRTIFSTNDPCVDLRVIFIDRLKECLSFDEALSSHYQAVCGLNFDPEDLLAPRQNTLVFFGVGGIGKTSLSRALEARHSGVDANIISDWPEAPREFDKSVSIRVDLASDSGIGFEQALLLLRAAVAGLGHPMHAFDTAFSRYWEYAHPDGNLSTFLRSNTILRRTGEALRLSDQIQEGLKEVTQSLGGSSTAMSLASQVALSILQRHRRRQAVKHAVENCKRLAPLLEAECSPENLSYYPHLLSWDLHQLFRRSKRKFHVAVFLDTFEDVNRDGHRDFQEFLRRMVWLMPNVLFVISGRNRLDWADAEGDDDLPWNGPISWPALVANSSIQSAQHRVAAFSPSDCDLFLTERLQQAGGAAISRNLRSRIAVESEGLPLHLDLAVTRYLQMARRGTSPSPKDFSGGFPELVSRILRDLAGEERQLVRILSLLDSFDLELASAVASLTTEATAVRLSQRPFVEFDGSAPFPYSLHRLVRSAVQVADGPDDFTPADWARYAAFVFNKLGERYYRAVRDGDRTLANSALNQALRLADERSLELGWCVDAAYAFVEDSLWEGSVRPLIGGAGATPAAALAQTLLAIVNQRTERRKNSDQTRGDVMSVDLRETGRVLVELLDSDRLPDGARDLATYYAAETMRELGDGARAEELLSSIPKTNAHLEQLASKGLVHRLRRLGRFRELENLISAQPHDALWLQMAGGLSWSQGLFRKAQQEYKKSRDLFLESGYLGNADELLALLAFVSGLEGKQTRKSSDLLADAMSTLRGSRNRWASLMAELGGALLDADGTTRTENRLVAIASQGEAAGLTSIQAYASFSMCLNGVIGNESQLAGNAREALVACTSGGDFHWLLEIVGFWTGTETVSKADWIRGVEATRVRWREVVLRRGMRTSDKR
jgi:hypothetical protein